MGYRAFGRTGWRINEISFGTWQLGGQWGAVDDAESVASLRRAYDAGINLVDTAQMYGTGHSESIVGRSLRNRPDDAVRVATKVQPLQWPGAEETTPAMSTLYTDSHLRASVEGSLKRLGRDRIDLLQLHCWSPDGVRDRDWLDTLHVLRREGKIDRIGVSLRDYRPEDGVELARLGMVDSIQVIYNIFEQEPERALLPAAAASGTAVIARVALDSGSLSGAWTPEVAARWERDSVLSTVFRGERLSQTLERVTALKTVVRPFYRSLAEAAIRFALHPPAVSTTVIGMSTARRLAQNLSYADGAPFPPALIDLLRPHEWRRNYYI